MAAKDFLLQESANVKELLAQTLRNEYGPEGSRDFFEECATRLEFITSELQGTADADTDALGANGALLSELSRLICRIERSSLGEYSWPFVEQLKKIATSVCIEPSLSGTSTPPKVYVLADGGLDAYAMYAERSRPSASKRRLLTIVFPKSLKHFVLLHPILGHEVGHAIWRCSKHQGELDSKVIAELKVAGGIFADRAATTAHLFSAAAPQEAKDYLSLLFQHGISQNNFFQWADWDAWIEEILCDLIGLTTFGPGFAAAHAELLFSLDPSGVQVDEEHPPVAWRVNFIRQGAKLLGYDVLPPIGTTLHTAFNKFWTYLDGFRKPEKWYDVFPDAPLQTALTNIKALLLRHPPSAYTPPTFDTIGHLHAQLVNLVPPIGFSMSAAGEPTPFAVDFRHIIYAGWIATRHEKNIPFGSVNRLCEHAVMQQSAIDISLAKRA